MMSAYACLQKQQFTSAGFSLVPLRKKDKYDIMRWRNEQLYHLRQSKLLTKQDQDHYFENTVAALFQQPQPTQLLFSYLQEDICIGYGGLVHINQLDKNAELSFIINTELEKDFFDFHWANYLGLIEQVAFNELNLHKIFTFAFDLRPQLYNVLQKSGYKEEARLKAHCYFENKFIDVLIHTKINSTLTYRKAVKDDMLLYFDWANEEAVRKQSFQSNTIQAADHEAWFLKKIADENCIMLVFENDHKQPVGQIRFEKQQQDAGFIIGISVDKNERNKGLAAKMIQAATNYFFTLFPTETIVAYIKKDNTGSIKAFEKAGFSLNKEIDFEGVQGVSYTKIKTE